MTKLMPSRANLAPNQLRDTARVLRKPQAVVARNWLNTPAMVKYRPGRGITRREFDQYMVVAQRLAAVVGQEI